MNRLGALAPAVRGFFVPLEQPARPQLESPTPNGQDGADPEVLPGTDADQRR
jgi:hypothetical protein